VNKRLLIITGLLTTLLTPVFSYAASVDGLPLEVTGKASSPVAHNQSRIVVLTMSSCPHCADLKANVLTGSFIRHLKDKYGTTVVFQDVTSNPGIANKLGLQGVPDLLFYNSKGKLVTVKEGEVSQGEIESVLGGM